MPFDYDELIATGYIGRIKRDVVIEAADDLMYLCHIQKNFEDTGISDNATSAAFTIRLATDLLDKGLCQLATFAAPPGSTIAVPGDALPANASCAEARKAVQSAAPNKRAVTAPTRAELLVLLSGEPAAQDVIWASSKLARACRDAMRLSSE